MREYRGKRKDNGEWIYGSLLDEDIIVAGPVDVDEDYIGLGEWCSVDPETVGQYTGCGDIYEGDILRHWNGSVGTIERHDSWCGFYFKTALSRNEDGELVKVIQSVPLWNDLPRYHKLGNRIDNPDLLGEVRE